MLQTRQRNWQGVALSAAGNGDCWQGCKHHAPVTAWLDRALINMWQVVLKEQLAAVLNSRYSEVNAQLSCALLAVWIRTCGARMEHEQHLPQEGLGACPIVCHYA